MDEKSMVTYEMDEQEFQIDIREYLRIIMKRKILIMTITIIIVLIAGIRIMTQREMFTAQSQIQIASNDLVDVVRLTSDVHWYEMGRYLNTQYNLLDSHALYESLAQKIREKKYHFTRIGAQEETIFSSEVLGAMAEIKPVEESHLVDIIYTTPDPDLSAVLANEHAQVFIEMTIQRKAETTTAASDFIQEQIQTIQREIEEDEKLLQDLSEDEQIVKAPDQEEMTLTMLSQLNNQHVSAKLERINLESKYEENLKSDPQTLPEVQKDPVIISLKKDIADMERDIFKMSKRFQEDWPELQRLKSELEQTRIQYNTECAIIKDKIVESSLQAYKAALKQENEYARLLGEQQDKARKLELTVNKYDTVRMRIEKKKAILSNLILRGSEHELSARLKGLKTANVWIVDYAKSNPFPSFPKKMRTMSISILIGLILGVGFAFFLEYLDRTIQTSEMVERYLQLPFLGLIPEYASLNGNSNGKARKLLASGNGDSPPIDKNSLFSIELATYLDPRSTIAEAFHNIRTSIILSSEKASPQKIMITSSQASEGKTTTSINLAISLTQLNKKVVLIDADMRNPRIHNVLSLDPTFGLSNFLQNGLDANLLIKKCEVPDLGVITSGDRPENPSQLLSTTTMQKLLEKLCENFDHVIIDTPPVLAVADAMIISKMVDSNILVVHGGKTPREIVARAKDKLQSINTIIQGVVLTNVDVSLHSPYSYYYYPYEYGYSARDSDNGKKKLENKSLPPV